MYIHIHIHICIHTQTHTHSFKLTALDYEAGIWFQTIWEDVLSDFAYFAEYFLTNSLDKGASGTQLTNSFHLSNG